MIFWEKADMAKEMKEDLQENRAARIRTGDLYVPKFVILCIVKNYLAFFWLFWYLIILYHAKNCNRNQMFFHLFLNCQRFFCIFREKVTISGTKIRFFSNVFRAKKMEALTASMA